MALRTNLLNLETEGKTYQKNLPAFLDICLSKWEQMFDLYISVLLLLLIILVQLNSQLWPRKHSGWSGHRKVIKQ